MKKILIALAVVFALFAGGFYIFTKTHPDQVVRRQLRAMLEEATQTKAWVQRAMIALDQGQGQIEDIRIKNPDGFSKKEAITIPMIMTKFNPPAMSQERVLTVQEIVIDRPQILFETNADQKGNLRDIQRVMQNYANEKIAEKVKMAKDNDPSLTEQWRLIVNEVKFTGGEIVVIHPSLTEGPIKIPMKEISLRNLGGNRNGLYADELMISLLGVLCKRATMEGSLGLAAELAKKNPYQDYLKALPKH
ncbi:MAG: hypothetical protein EOM37_09080 [Proteobacteria bacterium]|nr:hypothetical protein [Pseudomonadota bacterium]